MGHPLHVQSKFVSDDTDFSSHIEVSRMHPSALPLDVQTPPVGGDASFQLLLMKPGGNTILSGLALKDYPDEF